MLALRLFFGAVSVGLLFGAFGSVIEARTASETVSAVLMQSAMLGALIAVALGAIALCCDHRTASEQRARARFARKMQRERNRATLDAMRSRTRSRNRF